MSKRASSGPQPLTYDERNKIYFEVVFSLMGLEIWELEDESIKKFKIMLKLYLDYGKEFSGELEIKSIDRKLIYNLHNDRNKKTVAYLSKDRYLKAMERRDKTINKQPVDS
jgi:hypothetical protein